MWTRDGPPTRRQTHPCREAPVDFADMGIRAPRSALHPQWPRGFSWGTTVFLSHPSSRGAEETSSPESVPIAADPPGARIFRSESLNQACLGHAGTAHSRGRKTFVFDGAITFGGKPRGHTHGLPIPSLSAVLVGWRHAVSTGSSRRSTSWLRSTADALFAAPLRSMIREWVVAVRMASLVPEVYRAALATSGLVDSAVGLGGTRPRSGDVGLPERLKGPNGCQMARAPAKGIEKTRRTGGRCP